MSQLCMCWPCASLTDRHKSGSSSPSRQLLRGADRTGTGDTLTPQQRQGRPTTTTYRHGLHWRLQQILHQQCQSRGQLLSLLSFVNSILDNAGRSNTTLPTTISSWPQNDANLLQVVLDSLPQPTAEAGKETRERCRELLQLLEKSGRSMSLLNAASKDTPLLRAIKTGNRAALDALLHTRCDINATDRYSSTCLIYAVKWNDLDTVRTILARFRLTVNLDKTDYANYTALAYAASNNSLELCSLLLQAGARPDVNSTSPLFLAVSNNASLDLVHLLISKGASVNVSSGSDGGLNAVAAAARNRRPEMVSLLLTSGAHVSPAWHKTRAFLIALSTDHLAVLKILTQHGMDVTCANPKGSTVVHEACSHGSAGFLSHLIQTTSDVVDLLDVRNRQRRSAAHYAAHQGHSRCLEVLFYAGGDCWSLDPQGQSTLEIALFNNRSDCVSFLVHHPVFPRQRLFSTLHMLRNDYDPEALGRKPAVALFASLLRDKWGEGNQVDSLLTTCVIAVRRMLRQKPASKVAQLPLPEKVKSQILSYQ